MRWILVLSVTACCTRNVQQSTDCWEQSKKEDFAVMSDEVVTKVKGMSEDDCTDTHHPVSSTEGWKDKCDKTFESVMTDHCTPEIDRWCQQNCANRVAECQGEPHRSKLARDCALGAHAAFRQASKLCEGLEQDPQTPSVFLKPASGLPACLHP